MFLLPSFIGSFLRGNGNLRLSLSSCLHVPSSSQIVLTLNNILTFLFQTMEVGDFTSTVACFMRLTWAAAAGRLDLVGSPQPIRETHSSLLPQGVRTSTRVSSTGDTGNTHAYRRSDFQCCGRRPDFILLNLIPDLCWQQLTHKTFHR